MTYNPTTRRLELTLGEARLIAEALECASNHMAELFDASAGTYEKAGKRANTWDNLTKAILTRIPDPARFRL